MTDIQFDISIGIIWMLVSIAGVLIPLVGIFVLMGKEQSKSSTNLMVANIGCLIMNGAYFLLLRTGKPAEATMALKMEYLGNFLFYFFFIKFILSYMQIDVRHRWVRVFTHLWMLFEVAVIALVWDDTRREEMFAHHDLEVDSQFGYHFFNMQGGIVYKVRYGFLLGFLLILILYMIIKRVHIRKQGGDEKHNLSHLIVAKFVIIIPLVMEIVFRFSFEFVPVWRKAVRAAERFVFIRKDRDCDWR